MDFIERWLGFSPDGGDGTVEHALILGSIIIASAAFLWWQRGRVKR